ncbi:MAG: peptidoglycan bridge formation glycyltransferase FemA/FemB family protein [Anaerolineales bacterium]|nr:peptidoglycan bridge formation glycyltransferase FemA/FemB family protein [Anaerolineales bacterium]
MASIIPPEEWDSFTAEHPEAHLLQSSSWGELKASFGWEVTHVQSQIAGAQILFRPLALGTSLAYIPKGPIGPWLPDLLPTLDEVCRDRNAILLKTEPDEFNDPNLAEVLQANGFSMSNHEIQPRQTILIDLDGSEDEILGRMNQKTRYNIRLAGRKEVHVRPWDDFQGFGQLMQQTATRDGFGTHIPAYYQKAYELFHPKGQCELLVAEYESQPLAAVMVFLCDERAWYLYGASSNTERNRMPNYLLQWEAMRWAREQGCTKYDLWGIPDADVESLESDFTNRSDGLWGVYRFKRGFGGEIIRSIGTWDRPYVRPLATLYNAASSLLWK